MDLVLKKLTKANDLVKKINKAKKMEKLRKNGHKKESFLNVSLSKS